MHLTTLVAILEREQPNVGDHAATRGKLAQFYADRGHHAEAKREAARALSATLEPDMVAELERILTMSP